jgi:O-succinylbenzoic acid--CoA ligase
MHNGVVIPDWLSRRAADTPDLPALIAGTGPSPRALKWTWTWRELERRAAALAASLAAIDVAPGDRVAVLLSNGEQYVEIVHALIRMRAVLVPVNTRLTPEEMAWQAQNSGARLLLYHASTSDLANALHRVLPDLPRYAVSDIESEIGATVEPAPASIDLAAVHSIIYTSGTSGRPKGALLTYGNHWWNAMGSALNLGLHGGDRWLACLPLFHVGGLSIVMRGVIYGIPVVLPDTAGFDPVAVNRAIDEDGVTIVSVVGTMLARMLEARGSNPYPAALRCVLLGGGPAPRPLLEECARRGIPVTQTYGLTETASQLATLAPADALRKLGSAGRPLLPNELRIQPLPRDGEMLDAAATGEILVRGPSVTTGYLRDDGTTEVPFPATDAEGWLHTGDLGYLDAEGYLYVLDRRVDLIVTGGENVYPAEVEAVLHSHPAVAEAAAYGVGDDVWGQRVAAAIVVRPDARADEQEITAFCRERLAAYKVPSLIRLVDALPRNAAGKLLRRKLRDG